MSVRRRARSTHSADARIAGAPGRRGSATPRAPSSSATPRYLAAAAPVLVQRQEETSLPEVPRLQLTPPSLLQPRDPYARFRPDFGNRLHLDPDLELRMLALSRTLLSPSRVLGSVAAVAPVVPPSTGPGGSPTPATGTPPPTAGGGPISPVGPVPPTPASGAAPLAKTPPPATTPSPEGEEPRAGTPGDVLGAVLKMPQVTFLLEDVEHRFTSDFSRFWRSASLGEQVGFVSGSVVVGGAMLAPLLGFEQPREFFLPLLNGIVLPVPGLDGYGLEFNFGERDVMVGVHVDVGRLLPSFMGFGEASFTAIGGPPEPGALPPVSRQAEGALVGLDDDRVAAGIRARSGRGAPLDDDLRDDLEAPLGADLSGVRLHTDAAADALAVSVRARAFTSGSDIFFRAGRYDADSGAGRRLLAHELVHVTQQGQGAAPTARTGSGLEISEPGDAREREADVVAEDVVDGTAPGARRALAAAPPTAAVQRQPEPKGARAPGAKPVPSAQAKQAAPPAWTDYFDEVVPAVLEAAESNEKIGLERALWLITQAYGEQSPGVAGPPSRHRNRLFNEQASVEMENGKIKRVLPGQESEGVSLYNLAQNESPTRDRQDIKSSPTFGYDTPERAAHHHVKQLEARWGGAYAALTDEKKGSFEGFAHALKAAGFSKSETYDTDLIALKGQVRGQVAAWVQYRLPEMRERIPRMEAYLEFLREQHTLTVRAAEEWDPVGFFSAEVAVYLGMIQAMVRQIEDVRTRYGRLERFAGVLGVKVK